MSDPLAVLDRAVRVRGLQMPAPVRGLVLLVHRDCDSQQRSGQRFIADVLRANGLATLTVTLHPAEEQRAGLPLPGRVLIKHRLHAVFDWLATQAPARQTPVALLGVDDAVCGCVAAVARYRSDVLRSLILLDGRPYHVAQLLARLSQPTLMVVGACDARSVNRHRAALRQMTAPSRLEVLALSTQPRAAPGAHQALAHVAMRWLESTMWSDGTPQAFAQAAIGTTLPQLRGRNAAGAGR
jgi:putative phosphoribosyl transferase